KSIPKRHKIKKLKAQVLITGFQDSYQIHTCRSAFKLLEIDDRFKILYPGSIVLDCGAAPGSWTQIAVQRVNSNGANGATLFGNMDFTTPESQKTLTDFLKGEKVHVVISDMAPNATGVKHLDKENIIKLCYAALKFAVQMSVKDASLLVKLWQCEDMKKLVDDISRFYSNVKVVKPNASRSDSA
ncbi:hypothetical protein NQ317_010070, partial [Molorchus minor]